MLFRRQGFVERVLQCVINERFPVQILSSSYHGQNDDPWQIQRGDDLHS